MLNAADHVATARAFAQVFKMAEGFVFIVRSGANLDKEFKKHTVAGIAFKYRQFLRRGCNRLEASNSDPFPAALGHFQMPHARHDSRKLGRKEGN
jgi:hypothetical protein